MDNTKKLLGLNLRRLRKEKDLTQTRLATMIDMEYQYIGAIERGEKNPTLNVLVKLATALDATIATIFCFEDYEGVDIADKVLDHKIDSIVKRLKARDQPLLFRFLNLIDTSLL